MYVHESSSMKPPEGDDVMVARVKSGHKHSEVVGLWAAVGQVDHLKEEEDHLFTLTHSLLASLLVTAGLI